MLAFLRRCTPFFLILLVCTMEVGLLSNQAEAKAQSGGRSLGSSSRPTSPPPIPYSAPSQFGQQQQTRPMPTPPPQSGGFGRSFAGGLLGGALGGLLFGSLFGASGSGTGILPLLLLAGVGYFLYKRFINRPGTSRDYGSATPNSPFQDNGSRGSGFATPVPPVPPIPPIRESFSLEDGVEVLRRNDPGFDPQQFVEMASEVFFKVQAGWMRRDLESFRQLLGNQLAGEYAEAFAKLHAQGRINMLESMAIRKTELVAAGNDNGEDFATVLFTANLLDYTVDDKTGAVLEGSKTDPVRFAQRWTWARPAGSGAWRLEQIEDVAG